MRQALVIAACGLFVFPYATIAFGRVRLIDEVATAQPDGAARWNDLVAAGAAYDDVRTAAYNKFGEQFGAEETLSLYGPTPGHETEVDYFLIDAAQRAGVPRRLDQLMQRPAEEAAIGEPNIPGDALDAALHVSRLCAMRMRRAAVEEQLAEVVRSAQHISAILDTVAAGLTDAAALRSVSVSVMLLDQVRQLALERTLDEETLEKLSRIVAKADPWPPLDAMLEVGIIDERVRDRARKPVEPEEGLGSAGNWLSLMTLIDTKRVGTRLVISLERYRLAEGQFPDELEALAPRFIEKVPGDPATGMPLEYRREGDGYTLYSLGVDRVDDGGKTAPLAHKALEPDPARHAGLDYVLNEPRPRAIGH